MRTFYITTMSFGRKWIKVEGCGRHQISHIKAIEGILFRINGGGTTFDYVAEPLPWNQ